MRGTAAAVSLFALAVAAGCGGDDEAFPSAADLDLSQRPACFAATRPRAPLPGEAAGDDDERPRGAGGPAIGIAPTDDPVGECARAWRRGEVQVGTAGVPRLKVCVGRGGRPQVLPERRGNACRRVGLPDPEYLPAERRPGFEVDDVDDADAQEVRRHSRRFCRGGVRNVAAALDVRPRPRPVVRALARGYPRETRAAARRGCRAGLGDR